LNYYCRYFFEIDGGKKIRPTMVLIMAYALNSQLTTAPGADSTTPVVAQGYASPSQKRLAEITEMIHTASLFHDDVIDKVGEIVLLAI
jgi:geranyl diphosphate synthase